MNLLKAVLLCLLTPIIVSLLLAGWGCVVIYIMKTLLKIVTPV